MVDAVMRDHRSAPISAKEKALFDYVVAANDARGVISREWTDKARAAGWSDAALYDAATVVALFNFYNRWTDATGVHDMPAAAYQMSGQRLAQRGYVF